MKNKFIKPEVEILSFLCEGRAPDSYWRVSNNSTYQNHSIQLPDGNEVLGGDNTPGGDLGVPYQQ